MANFKRTYFKDGPSGLILRSKDQIEIITLMELIFALFAILAKNRENNSPRNAIFKTKYLPRK